MNKPRHLLQVVVCLLCCWLSVACSDELSPGSSGLNGGGGSASAGSLLLTLQVPGIPAAGDAATRAATPADECRIDPAQLHLLLFDPSGDKYVFYRYASPTNLKEVAGSNPRRYTLEIPFKAGEFNRNYRMMVVANLPLSQLKKAGGGEDFPAFRACSDRDNPVEAVRNLIICDNPGDEQTGRWPVGGTAGFIPFPMWEESAAFNARPQGNIGTLNLIRAVARIDVGINFKKNPDGTYPLNDMRSGGVRSNGNGRYFKLMSTSVYRIPRSAWIGPRDENFNAQAGTVTAATATGDMPDAPRQYVEADLSTDPDAADPAEAENRRALTRTVYVPEAANHGQNRNRAACLVVGGVYGEGNTTTTYYRIDIYDRTPGADGNMPKPTPENRMDILRNHAYVVNITSVSGPGAATEEEALQADNTHMEIELSDWDQDQPVGDITSDGVYSLNLSRTEQEYYSDGSPVDFTIETNYDGELGKGWQMEADEVAKQFVVFYDKAGHEITYGSPDWPAQGKNGVTNLRIGWKEFEQPASTTVVQARQAVLTFTAGRMKVRCMLRQLSRELLRINFTPPEMNFSREPQNSQHIGIEVTTRKSYELKVDWKNEAGANCTWNLTNPAVNPPTSPDSRFRAENLFVADPAGKGYLLKPENSSANTPRAFVFTFTATNTVTGIAGTNVLTVYQSNLNVDWKVEGGAGAYGNEVIAPNNAQSVSARIVTDPGSLTWYFSRPQDAGRGEWITNLDAIIGAKQTGGGDRTFSLQPNKGLGRRSYTLQARSTEGLDEYNSRLVLIQRGMPLLLKPSLQGVPGAVTETTGSDGKTLYTLDCGTALSAGAPKTVDMTSNTDWFWRWDRSSPAFEKNYKNIIGTSFAANPAEDRATTGGPADGTTQKTWAGVFSFNTPEQRLKTDAELWAERGSVPLGGAQGITMDLRNKNVELEEEDVEYYRRRFRIQRFFPSYQNIMYWPCPDSENLDMHADEIVAGTETPFRVRTNATGRVECFAGRDRNNLPSVGHRDFAASGGYDEFTIPLRELGVQVNANSWNQQKTWVKLRYTGPKREMPDAADNPAWSAERYYFYGQEINMPTRNMLNWERWISWGEQNLVFDFSNSTYKKLKVRVRLETTSTNHWKEGKAAGIPDEYPTPGGAGGYEIVAPETRLRVHLGPAPVNMFRRVWLEYWDGTENRWRNDKSPEIWQDAQPVAGYVVWYWAFPNAVNNGTWTVNPWGTQAFPDVNGWRAASPLQRPDLMNIQAADQAVRQAQAEGTTACTAQAIPNIRCKLFHEVQWYWTQGIPVLMHPVSYFEEQYGTATSDWEVHSYEPESGIERIGTRMKSGYSQLYVQNDRCYASLVRTDPNGLGWYNATVFVGYFSKRYTSSTPGPDDWYIDTFVTCDKLYSYYSWPEFFWAELSRSRNTATVDINRIGNEMRSGLWLWKGRTSGYPNPPAVRGSYGSPTTGETTYPQQ